MLLQLARHQEALGDLQLLILDVAREADDLHAVFQGWRNGVQDVSRGDEEHFREIVGHVQVVIGEGVVLLRIEYLQQSGRRIATEVRADLVYLVEHEQRVLGASIAHGLDDAPRQGTDVGASVTADFCLVPDTAQGDSNERATQRLGNRLAHGGFARAGRSHKTEDRRAHLVGGQLAHSHVFQDSLFRLGQPVVMRIKDLFSMGDVHVVFCGFMPRQIDEPVQVRADDAHLWRSRGHHAQTLQFLRRFLLSGLRHTGGSDLLS